MMKHQYNETDSLLELVRERLGTPRITNAFNNYFDDHNVISIVEKDFYSLKRIPNFGDKSLKPFITFLITFDGFTASAKKMIRDKFGDDVNEYKIMPKRDFKPSTQKKIYELRKLLKSEGYMMHIRKLRND